jgi:hypothetical protein
LSSRSRGSCLAITFLVAGAAPVCAQSAASHPMITMQDVFDCYGQARALKVLAESARDNVDVAAAAAKDARTAEQRREVVGILRAGVRAQQTALQLADALEACVAELIKPSASWPSARSTMFRLEADAVLVGIDRFIDRYAHVSKSLTEATRLQGAADAGAGVLPAYGGFGEALKQKVSATRQKMNALGKPAPAASPTPP